MLNIVLDADKSAVIDRMGGMVLNYLVKIFQWNNTIYLYFILINTWNWSARYSKLI